MSLEEKIGDLIKAVRENTDAIERSLEHRNEALKTIKEVSSKGEPKAKESKSDKAAGSKGKKDDSLSDTGIRKAFGAFMQVDDEDEREMRKKIVVKVLDEFDSETSVDLKPADRQAALDRLDELLKKKSKKKADRDDEDEEEEDRSSKKSKKSKRDDDDEDDDDDRSSKKSKKSKRDDDDEEEDDE